MGRLGRPRKATSDLKVHGGYREDRHGDRRNEPQPGGQPTKPTWMEGPAAEHWDEVVPGLIATGVATSADQHALELLCEWWAQFQRAKAYTGKAYARSNMMATATKSWRDLASRFGLTPSDRASLQVKPSKQTSDLEELIG